MSAVLSVFDQPANSGYGSDRQIAQLRIPPHSIEGESSVLGGLLLDNAAWDRVGDLLTDQDFYRAEHKLITPLLARSSTPPSQQTSSPCTSTCKTRARPTK